jgi:hypothetical protein
VAIGTSLPTDGHGKPGRLTSRRSRWHHRVMMRRLRLALPLLALVLAALPASAGAAHVRLPRPPFPAAFADVARVPGSPKLALVSSRANSIIDVRAWFRRNRIVPGEWRVGAGGDVPGARLPGALARTFRGAPLLRAIRDGQLALLVYGRAPTGRYLVGADRRTGAVRWSYDLGRWGTVPGTLAGRGDGVLWADVAGGTLYVSTAHDTFASSSGGRTAYIRAIDLATSKVRWTSPALVANADTFVVTGNVIATGYGFTDEPDGLFLLDRASGRPLAYLPVSSAPEYLALRRGLLLVRAYDRDLVVRITRR